MEVQVVQGSWRAGSILSLRVGEMRHQAALQFDTRINISKAIQDVDDMQVDVFARVGSTRLAIEPSQEVYNLNFDGDGFSNLALSIRPQQSACGQKSDLDPRRLQDHQDRCESQNSNGSLDRIRQKANDYIHCFSLRDVLQDLFKAVIKDMPEDPFIFMTDFLQDHPSNKSPYKIIRVNRSPSPANEKKQQHRDGDDRWRMSPTTDQPVPVDRNGWLDLQEQYEERIESQQVQILLLEQRLQDLEVVENASAAREAEAAAWQAERERMLKKQLECEHAWQVKNDALQQQVHELERRLATHSAMVDRFDTMSQTDLGWTDMVKRVESQQRRIQALESELAKSAIVSSVPPGGRTTPADEAAGGAEVSSVPRAMQQTWMSPDRCGSVATPRIGSAEVTPSPGSEVNTHMLSKLLASTYAPPVAPAALYEPREDLQEDIGQLGKQSRPELLVEVVDCMDKDTNGIFACVGRCNDRPLYRLLGVKPRYLYYSQEDVAWAGWWISDKTGSENYVEWFKDPAEARLPVFCRKGELGSRVVEAALTPEVLQNISQISSQAEKTTIRSALTEAFGSRFIKMDGSQRGLMSKTSPVVAVAHAMEAQQRAIQFLHSQLAAETQRREAAEVHAQTMEEAFEMLQLRIQAKMPGPMNLAVPAKPKPCPLSPASTEEPHSITGLESLTHTPMPSP